MSIGYYAYVMGDDGHVRNRIDVVCDNDEEAKRCAQQLLDGQAIELWQEARRGSDFSAQRLKPSQLASCPAYIRILPGVVMRSLPSRSTM